MEKNSLTSTVGLFCFSHNIASFSNASYTQNPLFFILCIRTVSQLFTHALRREHMSSSFISNCALSLPVSVRAKVNLIGRVVCARFCGAWCTHPLSVCVCLGYNLLQAPAEYHFPCVCTLTWDVHIRNMHIYIPERQFDDMFRVSTGFVRVCAHSGEVVPECAALNQSPTPPPLC